jgi:hypothetical protein
MSTVSSTHQTDQQAGPSKRKRLMAVVVYTLVLALLLMLLADRPEWVMGWALAIVMGITTLFAPVDRDFIEERTRIKADVKSWDKPLRVILSVAPFTVFVMAGLDKRFGWSSPIAAGVQVVVLVAQLGYAWAIASNKFFARLSASRKNGGIR